MHFSALSQICWPCLVAILNIRRLKFGKSPSSGQACSLSAPKAFLKKFSQAYKKFQIVITLVLEVIMRQKINEKDPNR